MLTRGEINSRCHIIRQRLDMDLETFRAIVADVDSASEGHISRCSDFNAAAVLGKLQGESNARGNGKNPKSKIRNPKSALGGYERQNSIIPHLMEILGWNWSRTAEYCLQITGKPHTKKCSILELSKVIQGMVQTIEHHVAHGKIVLTHTQLFEFRQHTRSYRNA